jgi:hypothetical protein
MCRDAVVEKKEDASKSTDIARHQEEKEPSYTRTGLLVRCIVKEGTSLNPPT